MSSYQLFQKTGAGQNPYPIEFCLAFPSLYEFSETYGAPSVK